MEGRQKGIVGAIAIASMLIAVINSCNFNLSASEQNAPQIEEAKSLTGRILYIGRIRGRIIIFIRIAGI